jgi:hypothetical protein
MNVDRYTKAVLTVIAGCLLWMCVMGAGPGLQAQRERDRDGEVASYDLKGIPTAAQPVILVGTGTMDRRGNVEVFYNRRTTRTDPTLAVRLPYSPSNPMAVEISAVKKTGPWEPLRTDVEDVPLRPNPGPRPGPPR